MSRSVVAAMTAYTLELREAEVKLNQNESPFDLPRELKEDVLARVAERPWNLYPDFESRGLREALAAAYGFAPENILVGNGSNELLAAAVGAFVGPGTPVIIARPAFTLYEKLVAIAGGLVIPIDFDPDSGLLPLDQIVDVLERRPLAGWLEGVSPSGRRDATLPAGGDAGAPNFVVILCSPNNPTGGVLAEGGLEALLDSGATVLFDRAYGDFANDSLPLLHERLITFSTFSKAWGLAGLRVGWLASTAENCREIRKVKLPYSLNIVSEAIAAAALQHRELRDANVARTIAERERVSLAMHQLPRLDVFPSHANFIAFRLQRDCKEIFEELCARGVLVRDVSAYPRMRNCLRVSIGSREQNDRFLEALTSCV